MENENPSPQVIEVGNIYEYTIWDGIVVISDLVECDGAAGKYYDVYGYSLSWPGDSREYITYTFKDGLDPAFTNRYQFIRKCTQAEFAWITFLGVKESS